MKKIARLLILFALPALLAGCGKTDDEKAQDNARGLVEEHNRLVTEIFALTPDSGWTEPQLKDLENKVNRLDAVRGELRALNGSHGITITGGDSGNLIVKRRGEIADVRAMKTGGSPTTIAGKSAAKSRLLSEIRNYGKPSASWSNEDLTALEKKLDDAKALDEEIRRSATLIYTENISAEVAIRKGEIAAARAQKTVNAVRRQGWEEAKAAEREFDSLSVPAAGASKEDQERYAESLDKIEKKVDVAGALTKGGAEDYYQIETKRIVASLKARLKTARENFARAS